MAHILDTPKLQAGINMAFQVAGTIAFVTGANRGIGKAIVESLLHHGAAKVYAAVRDMKSADPLVTEYGQAIVPIPIDLGKPETILSAAQVASDVQLVVSNAGILRCATPLAEDAIKSLQEEIEVNVFGLIRMAQAFAPVLKANGGGAFVQLNSVASFRSFVRFSTYSASKAAAYSLTQALRNLLAEQNTQVLSVHPGPINTDMAVQGGIQDIAEPPSLVGEGIVSALAAGDFHIFPDAYAKQMEAAYKSFAQAVVEANPAE